MSKKLITVRLSEEALEKLEKMKKENGKSRTQIIEELILSTKDDDTKLQLLEQQNKQLEKALTGYHVALESKDEQLKHYEDEIQFLRKLVEDREKPFWLKLFHKRDKK